MAPKINVLPRVASLVFSILVLAFAGGLYVFAVFQEPTVAPPGGNVPSPLNVGPSGQTKQGGLILNTGGAAVGLIIDSGNLGIGTTTPGRPLHIEAVANRNIRLEEDGAGTEYFDIGIDNSGDLNIWRDSGAIALSILDVNGNVGIGTTSPSQKLDVVGAIELGSTSTATTGTIRWTGTDFEGYDGVTWASLTSGGGGGLWTDLGTYIRPNNTTQVAITDTGRIGIGTTSPGRPLHIEAVADRNIRLEEDGAGTEYFDIGIDNSGDLNIWRDSGAIALSILDVNGNVGIGTTSPSQKLDVVGAIELGSTGIGTAGTIRWTGTDFEGYDGVTWASFTSGGGGGLWTDLGTYIHPNNTTQVAITDSGNVGIGTTTPARPLHIEAVADRNIRLEEDGAGTEYFDIGIDNSGDLNIWRDSGAIALSILDVNGNVGIGTTSPSEKLDVEGNINLRGDIKMFTFRVLSFSAVNSTFVGPFSGASNTTGGANTFVGTFAGEANTTGTGNTFLGAGAGGGSTTGGDNTFIGFNSGSSSTGSGNVSIGSSAGRDELGSNKLYIANTTGTPLIYGDFATGRIGLGTTSPLFKLDVEGTIQATAFITGDITFQKDGEPLWRMFEDEDGLYVESIKTGKVYEFMLKEVDGK